jgi:hypothetical protein
MLIKKKEKKEKKTIKKFIKSNPAPKKSQLSPERGTFLTKK